MKEYIAEYIVPVEKKGNDNMFDFMNATPLIRCKDCKHWYEKYRYGVDMSTCKRAIGYFGANDYCSRAEREGE